MRRTLKTLLMKKGERYVLHKRVYFELSENANFSFFNAFLEAFLLQMHNVQAKIQKS